MGATFVTRTVRDSGAAAADVVRAFVVVDALTDARTLAAEAAAAGPAGETRILDALVDAVERAVRWLLAAYPSPGSLEAMVDRFRDAPAVMLSSLPATDAERLRARGAELAAAGVPAALAESCARVEYVRAGLDIVHVAATSGADPRQVAAAYWGVGGIFDFAWLRQAIHAAAGEDRWERRAVESLSAELDELRRALTRQLLTGTGEVASRVATFRLRRAATLERIRAITDDLRSARTITLPAIMVLVRELGRLQEVP
jgi:NAD-specific glutamate dehydrogenase